MIPIHRAREVAHFNRLLGGVAVISALLSLIALNTRDPINKDGILYIRTATLFLESGWQVAMANYPWPFFSIIIAEISRFTHLSLLHTAYLLESIFQVMIAVTFVVLVKEVSSEREHVWWGALIILIFPYFNSIRDYVIRDFGYWAFALMGLLCLIRYTRQFKWRYVLGWGLFMSLATLFRVEGAVLLALAPLALLSSGIKNTLKMYAIPLLGFGIACAWLFYHSESFSHSTGRGAEIFDQLQHGLGTMIQGIHERAALLSSNKNIFYVPLSYGLVEAFLIGGLISIVIVTFVSTLSPLYTLLVGYAQYHCLMPTPRSIKHILLGFILINILVLNIFSAQLFFIEKRYMVLLSLVLMLWIPMGLASTRRTMPRLFILMNVALVVMFVGGIVHFGYSKAYITDAGLWIKEHTPPGVKFYTNSPEVLFYADKDRGNWSVLRKKVLLPFPKEVWKQNDYVAIRLNAHDVIERKKLINQSPIKVFENKRGDRVIIYRMK